MLRYKTDNKAAKYNKNAIVWTDLPHALFDKEFLSMYRNEGLKYARKVRMLGSKSKHKRSVIMPYSFLLSSPNESAFVESH